MNQPHPPIIEKLLSASTTLDGLCKRITGEQSQEIAAAKNQLKEAILTLVVAGEIKKGKSSFINALLQQPGLVAVDDKVATSIACKIHHADVLSHRVHFLPDSDGRTQDPLTIDAESIAEYTTEEGNPSNKRNVAFVAIGCPSPFLECGIVLVDTPGIGGLVKSHRGITERFVPNADAVFYITDSARPLDAADVDFLNLLLKRTEYIYFIQSKSDSSASIGARDEIRHGNLKRIADVGIRQPVHYFVCSSRLKAIADESKDAEDLEDSGFVAVQDFILGSLKKEKDKIVCASMLRAMRNIADRLQTELDVRLKAYWNQSSAERQELEEQIGAARKKLEHWQREDLPALQSNVSGKMQHLKRDIQRQVEAVLDPLTGKVFEEIKNDIDAFPNVEALKQNYNVLFDRAASSAADCLYKQKGTFEHSVYQIIKEICEELGRAMPEIGQADSASSGQLYALPSDYRDIGPTTFTKATNVLQRGLMYSSIGASVGFLLTPVLGPLGPLLGAAAGAFFGGRQQLQEQHEQQLKAAKTKGKEDIARCLSRYFRDTLSRLGDIFIAVESELTKALRAIVRQHQDSLERLHLEFQERSKLSQEQSAKRQHELETCRKSVEEAKAGLKEIKDLIGGG